MRNLQRTCCNVETATDLPIACYGCDEVYTLSVKSGLATVKSIGSSRIPFSFDVPDLSHNVPDKVMNFHYNMNDDCLYVIMYGGDIIKVLLNCTDQETNVEIIGSIDEHILAAQWAPDNSIIAICTRATLNLLTDQFETIAEVAITDDDIGVTTNQVSVGWGRAETQFRGKRSQRDPTLPESFEVGILADEDSGKVVLSWRGDAAYVCLSAVSKQRRVLRVYSREGNLESTSEPLDRQLPYISWRPSGSLIMAVQRNDSVNRAVFFEKNGLKHGEADLRTTQALLSCKWNIDSTVIAVLYADFVDLWTISNYHYFHKQRITLSGGVEVQWHHETPLRLLITLKKGTIDLHLRWLYTTHMQLPHADYGLLAVVDGCNLGLTPLGIANVPPPMTFRRLKVQEIPIDVAISDDTSTFAILLSYGVSIYEWNLSQRPILAPTFQRSITFKTESGRVPLQFVISPQKKIYILFSDSEILEIARDQAESRLFFKSSTVRNLYPCVSGLLLQQNDGRMQHLNAAANSTNVEASSEYSQSCIVHQASATAPLTLIELSVSGKLYLSAQCIAQKVTSFLLVGDVLAYTTATQLNFLQLDAQKPGHKEDDINDQCRMIERGSVLVCACPSAQKIILQATRGNLETIFPRLLVLSSVRTLIHDLHWRSAWKLTKVHRIDPNIMHDCDPQLFFQNLSSFIQAIGSSLELDIFLTALKAENVCLTMYPDHPGILNKGSHLNSQQTNQGDEKYGKVNSICQAILQILENEFADSHSSSILTAHLTKVPADFASAIRLVASLQEVKKEKAITHMCFLAEPHNLYNQALGLYDLSTALQFAQRSQKDPKEYVPFLQRIQTLPLLRQKFILNDHLGNWRKAVEHLLQIPNVWDESVTYIARHQIWQHGLKCLKYDDRYKTLLHLYASHLFENQDYAAAGYAYESVKKFSDAVTSFERASLWREAMYNAKLATISCMEVASRMRDKMVEESRYSDAAEISQLHLDDLDSAIGLLCKAYKFDAAILLAATEPRVHDLVMPGLKDAFVDTSELYAEMRQQLQKQVPRLQEIRVKRNDQPEDFFNDHLLDDTPDNVSLAGTQTSTNASIFTRYTGTTALTTQSKKSGKARRRQERQRAKGKKGTIWEEEYLVNSIRRLVVRLGESKSETTKLITALVRCDMRNNATELQQSVTSLIDLARNNLDEVFAGVLTLPEELQRSMGTKPELGAFEPFRLC